MYRGRISPDAKIIRFEQQTTRALIARAVREGADVVSFPVWDADADELVVLNPRIVLDVVRVDAGSA